MYLGYKQTDVTKCIQGEGPVSLRHSFSKSLKRWILNYQCFDLNIDDQRINYENSIFFQLMRSVSQTEILFQTKIECISCVKSHILEVFLDGFSLSLRL